MNAVTEKSWAELRAKFKEKGIEEAWIQEPDFERFFHCGIPCAVIRMPEMGHLCGYVGVTEGHPWFKKPYDDVGAEIHGGLTYAGTLSNFDLDDGKHWWLGFDCAHSDDYVPSWKLLGVFPGEAGNYKTFEWVAAATKYLAAQAFLAGVKT